MTTEQQIYRATWNGHGRDFDRGVRFRIHGWLEFETDDDDAAREYYDVESGQLLDVDFIAPGQSYSASNGNVHRGEIVFPPSGEPREWEFVSAEVLEITRWDGSIVMMGDA